jgi:hypothetical protein
MLNSVVPCGLPPTSACASGVAWTQCTLPSGSTTSTWLGQRGWRETSSGRLAAPPTTGT